MGKISISVHLEYLFQFSITENEIKNASTFDLIFQSENGKLSRTLSRWTVQSYSPRCANVPLLANTIELVLPSAHLSPRPKLQIDRFSHFCTAHGRKSLYFSVAPFPPKLPLHIGVLNPHLIYDSLGPSEPTTETASGLVQPFLHR